MKKRFITGLIDLADETKKKMMHTEAANASGTPYHNRRSTFDSRPLLHARQTLQNHGPLHTDTLPVSSSLVRSTTTDSFEFHQNPEEGVPHHLGLGDHSYLNRNSSQRHLLANAGKCRCFTTEIKPKLFPSYSEQRCKTFGRFRNSMPLAC